MSPVHTTRYASAHQRQNRLFWPRSRRRPLSAISDKALIPQMPCVLLPQSILSEVADHRGGRRYDQGLHLLGLTTLSVVQSNLLTMSWGLGKPARALLVSNVS
jgi:hypothetical protein